MFLYGSLTIASCLIVILKNIMPNDRQLEEEDSFILVTSRRRKKSNRIPSAHSLAIAQDEVVIDEDSILKWVHIGTKQNYSPFNRIQLQTNQRHRMRSSAISIFWKLHKRNKNKSRCRRSIDDRWNCLFWHWALWWMHDFTASIGIYRCDKVKVQRWTYHISWTDSDTFGSAHITETRLRNIFGEFGRKIADWNEVIGIDIRTALPKTIDQ